MVSIEKLNGKNIHHFKILSKEAKDIMGYRLDFFISYNEKSFLGKYVTRKLMNLIKYNDKYIGYVWIQYSSNKVIYIQDIYIKHEYINYIRDGFPLLLKENNFVYEAIENSYSKELVNLLGMTKVRETLLLNLDTRYPRKKINYKLNYRKFKINEDEKLRCKIQNGVFRNNVRVPITPNDIRYDEKQKYYLKDLCIFALQSNNPIGYGQIIFNRGVYSVVNFGIVHEARGKGYGEEFLNKLIDLAKENNIKEVNIRVDSSNKIARNLYEKVGFDEENIFSTWIYNSSENHIQK